MQAGTGTDTVQQQQQQFGHSDMMLQGIHEENEARLAAMSADELDDARAELAARFSPASLEFLKSRRQQQQQQQVGAGAGSSVDAKGSSAAAARRGATPAVSRGLHGGCTGKASAAAAMTTSSTPSAVTTTDHAVGPLQQHNAPGVPVQLPPSQPTNLPPVARLRFGVEGELLSVDLPGAAAIQDADVLMRDSLSRATGTVPQGYSLPELRALLRSAHAPQRATGYRLLGTLLRRSRPGLHVLGEDGQLLPRPALLDLVPGGDSQQQRQQEQRQQEQQQQQQQSRDTGADWTQIWQYLLVALRAAALIRLGLDDDAAQVLAAAADAAAALLGQDPQEAVLGEAAACASALGWPCSWRTSLRRLNSSGAWESVAGLVAAAAATTTSGGGSRGGALGQHNADTDADTDTPEDLAAVDPLAGFLRMDPLPRLRFVLQRRCTAAAAAAAVIAVAAAIPDCINELCTPIAIAALLTD
jgi:RPAP1-like, N-terminal/RPAP1-like, C-terminal